MTKLPQNFRFTVKVLFISLVLFAISIAVTAVHEYVWKSDIIFYGFIKITAICTVIFIATMCILQACFSFFRRILNFSVIILSSIIFFFLSFSFNMTFPITIDRSFSVYMLGTLYKQNSRIPISDLGDIVSKYFHERSLIDKRIHEQLATGTIVINNGKVELTDRGKYIVKTHIFLGHIFNLEMNNIAP